MKVRRTVRPGLDRRQWVVVIKIICKRHFFVVWPAAAQLDKIIFLVSEVKYFLMKYFCAGNTRCAGVYGVCKKWLMAWCGAGTRTQTFMSSQVFHRDSRVNKFQFYFSSTRCTYVDICQFPLNNYWDKVDFLSVDLDLQEKVARTGWGREQVGCYDWWWWGWLVMMTVAWWGRCSGLLTLEAIQFTPFMEISELNWPGCVHCLASLIKLWIWKTLF